MLVPPMSILQAISARANQKWLDGAKSISLPGQSALFPLWALDYWREVHHLVATQNLWRKAVDWVKRQELHSFKDEVHETLLVLSTLAWSGHIPCSSTAFPKTTLLVYLSRDWFSDEQIDQMLDHLEQDIRAADPSRDIKLIDTALTTSIVNLYLKEIDGETYDPDGQTFVQRFGRSLNLGSEFGGMWNINSNHWIAAAVDILNSILWYGDPAGLGIDPTVISALRWFVSRHVPEVPEEKLAQKKLPCTSQNLFYDWWNCGLLVGNGLGTHYLPAQNALLPEDLIQGDLARMALFRALVGRYHEKVCMCTYQSFSKCSDVPLFLVWSHGSSSSIKQLLQSFRVL